MRIATRLGILLTLVASAVAHARADKLDPSGRYRTPVGRLGIIATRDRALVAWSGTMNDRGSTCSCLIEFHRGASGAWQADGDYSGTLRVDDRRVTVEVNIESRCCGAGIA